MRLTLPINLSLAITTAAQAGPPTDRYIDDRSSPERVVTSLYSAINRQEYLRAWSYFDTETAPPLDRFTKGYTDTARRVAHPRGADRRRGRFDPFHGAASLAGKRAMTARSPLNRAGFTGG